MNTRVLVLLAFAAFVAFISLVPGLATPAQADGICAEGTADLCASTCGEDHEGVEITEVCSTYNGQTNCTCCCYYPYED
jgi:hypothetical protein